MYPIIKVMHRNGAIMEEDRMRGKKGLARNQQTGQEKEPNKSFYEKILQR